MLIVKPRSAARKATTPVVFGMSNLPSHAGGSASVRASTLVAEKRPQTRGSVTATSAPQVARRTGMMRLAFLP